MNTAELHKQDTILIHPATYKKNKQLIDKIGCHVITANFVFKETYRVMK